MTVATNALLEGKVARTVLVATEGFTDVVELGRQRRKDLYRLCARHPDAARAARAARRRAGADGPRGRDPRRSRTRERSPSGCSSTSPRRWPSASCTPTASPSTSARSARRWPRAACTSRCPTTWSARSASSSARRRRRSTPPCPRCSPPTCARWSTAAARPASPAPSIMQSSGGLADAELAARHAALTVLSGPAGGAAAAALIAERTGLPDLLCFDMGGTSCDVCVVEDGRVRETAGREVGGRPLTLPMVDIHTVGAGGGSIGWIDPGGALRVGPAQRGRRPRPRVLRPRRHRADRHRREPRARPARPRHAAGRRRRARRARPPSARWRRSASTTPRRPRAGSCASPTPRWSGRCG